MSAVDSLADKHELPEGYRLEEFEIRRVLGSGGFGITYLAWDSDLKREVVIKENLPFQCAMRDSTRSVRPRTDNPADREQFDWALRSFLREAETLSSFDHPNIVRVLRRFEANNTAYFVMPYLPGGSLKQEIDGQVQRGEAYNEQTLRELLNPLLDALETLHAQGVYHRDIKAANILLVSGHRPILIDFGAARNFISEKSHTIVESAGYTPFEQLQSHGNVGPWSDLYALGGVFYTAVHGKIPPRASDRMRNDPIVCLAKRYGDLYSESFLSAIDWCLRVDERERPQSVADLRKALQASGVTTRLRVDQEKRQQLADETVLPPKKEPPKLTPPPVPPKPFPTALVLKWGRYALGGILLLLLIWHFALPFLAKPGSLQVTSDPAGAKVHISGQADTTTPAEFPRLRIGNYRVTVSAPGYDPVTRTVQIKQGAASVLDAGALQRSYGSLSLETVPPHAAYRLTGSAADNQKEYRGSTPVTLTHLPVDSYQLVLTAPDMDSRTLTVTIASGQTTTQTEDLVKLDVAGDAASPAAKALLGQVPVSSLDDAGKNEYRDLLHRTFEKYLQDGLLPAAADQIAAMKAAGQDTQAQDKELAQARAAYEQSSRGEIQRLIQDGKFGAATSRLNAVEAIGGKDMADRLHGQFDGPLSAYHQKVDAAIQASQQGDPAAGYNQLKAVADEYPGDFTVQMALGQLLTRLPPDHARLSERLAAFHDFNEEDLGPAELAQFQGLQAHIENELNTYDRLADALNKAKEGPGNLAARIRHLQYQIEEDQQKINAAQNVNSTVNSLAGLFHQHVTVVDVGEKENEIASDQAEIAQDQAAEQSPNSGVQQAQQQFDQFCATVPW